MSPFRCSLCIQPSIEFPQDFKAVLSDFIRVFNKLVLPCSFNCRDVGSVRLCRSCWVYLMRIHTLDEQLSVKKKTCDAKIAIILPKIRDQRSLVENSNDFQQDIQVQILTEENGGVVEDAAKSFQSQGGDSAASECSSDNPEDQDDSEIESLGSCANAASESTESSAVDKDPKENESARNSGLFESTTVKRKPSAPATAYENKWLPFNLTRLKYSPVVKRLSEVDFIYEDKYPFQGTETGFQCGLCPQICCFHKELPIWSNMIGHMKMWHRRGEGNRKVRANKVPHKFTQIAPDRFQYGPYFVDKIGESYRCGECGAMKSAGPTNKNAYKNIPASTKNSLRGLVEIAQLSS